MDSIVEIVFDSEPEVSIILRRKDIAGRVTNAHPSARIKLNSVETLEQWLAIAQHLGYEIRYDNLGESQGGICQIGKRKLLLLDPTLNSIDNLDIVRSSIRHDPDFVRFKSQISGQDQVPPRKLPQTGRKAA